MQAHTVGLYFNPWPDRWWRSKERLRNPIDLYRRGLWYKANPRDEAYMRSLFDEKYPEGRFVNVKSDGNWGEQLEQGGSVVLLYPDATGLGFASLERDVRARGARVSQLRALNGRRRDFVLDTKTRVALKIRRFMERTMLVEAGFMLVFVVVTPILLVIDWVRGRR